MEGGHMRTLHFGLRVADLERSLAFYAALGYEVVGSVPSSSVGDLTMIKLPGDAFVTIELVWGSSASAAGRGDGLSHFVIKVESMDAVLVHLAAEGFRPDEPPGSPDGSNEFRTAWITDPDGNRIELVQWPAGHPDGMTVADWPDA
jgi:lactoylglutathione lyase